MKFSFTVEGTQGDVYRVSLSSGGDAFFVQEDIANVVGNNIEIVEIDLERISGNKTTDVKVLSKIAEGIANYFQSNEKIVLYYYCDDMAEAPMSQRKDNVWPQEYRSHLFSAMYDRYIATNELLDMMDVIITIYEADSPLFLHLIARRCHMKYIELLKSYIIENYGK